MPHFMTVCITHAHICTWELTWHTYIHMQTPAVKRPSQPGALPSPHEPWDGCFYHHAHFPDEGIRVKHRSDLQCPTVSKLCPGSSLTLGPQPASPQALSCALGAAIIQLGDTVFSASSQNQHTWVWRIPAHSKGPEQ